jgi:hypothetical protein
LLCLTVNLTIIGTFVWGQHLFLWLAIYPKKKPDSQFSIWLFSENKPDPQFAICSIPEKQTWFFLEYIGKLHIISLIGVQYIYNHSQTHTS